MTPERPKRTWQRVDGVLLLDKSSGMTSNAALQSARRLFSAAKAGHTGTLDPLATGLLPLCFGEATKFSADLLNADKTYEAVLRFGITTVTGDVEGAVIQQRPVEFGQCDLESVLLRFHGQISQIPPMYSALKRDGQPLYRLARQGIEVDREAREVTIHALQLLDYADDHCRLRVTCSKGTYIRTLAEDIGSALGCGAHLTALRRVAVGSLVVADALTLAQLTELADAARQERLSPPDTLLQTLPAVHLDDVATQKFTHGNPVGIADHLTAFSGKCRVYGQGRLLGLGAVDQANGCALVRPQRLMVSG